MRASTLVLILLLQGALVGCAPFVSIIDFYDADSDTLRRYKTIEVLDSTSPDTANLKKIGEVDGLYCKRHHLQPVLEADLARAQAIDQVKLRAAKEGARYISEPQCVISSSVDFSNNCMGTLTCTSSAFSSAD